MASTSIIDDSRVQRLNDTQLRDGKYVLYWMQQSQRAESNHALEYAIQQANTLGLRLAVGFGLTDDYPEANARHYRFMLEGLQATAAALRRRKIPLVVRPGAPDAVALELAGDAAIIVCDRGYLRHQRIWRRNVAEQAECPVVQVESDVVVPVDVASQKAEYAARTIRPKIHAHLDDYLIELRTTALEKNSTRVGLDGLDLSDLDSLLDSLDIDHSVPPVPHLFTGGTSEARARLSRFLTKRFKHYDEHRNRPETDDVTHLGMYLHFGQISPIYVALQALKSSASKALKQSFIEELVIRRELAVNFVQYTSKYDSYSCLPDWARKTLAKHKGDEREHRYTKSELETAQTHDRYWNAAMRELRYTGYMHNYMRMYWGKKILEWTGAPSYAHKVALELNNRYFLDGRDPNSFANVAWVFGLHDRPWGERDVFGTVRYMSAAGLERKADIERYVEKVEKRVREAKRAGVAFDDA